MKTGQCKFVGGLCQCGKKQRPASETLVLSEYADAMDGGYMPTDLTFDEARAIAAIRRMKGMTLRG